MNVGLRIYVEKNAESLLSLSNRTVFGNRYFSLQKTVRCRIKKSSFIKTGLSEFFGERLSSSNLSPPIKGLINPYLSVRLMGVFFRLHRSRMGTNNSESNANEKAKFG